MTHSTIIFIFVFFGFLSSCQNPNTDVAAENKLLWGDEFNYEGLPDTSKWSHEVGFVRNNEAQYYTNQRLKNARVENGKLIITAHKEDYNDAAYTSASLHTKGKHEFTYGRIEVKAKVPQGRGVWPAIWTLGTNISDVGWPACGEIDILEFVGHTPDSIYTNVHTKDYNHSLNTGRGATLEVNEPWKDFHVYAVEWRPERIDFYFDDEKYFTCEDNGEGIGAWPFRDASQYLLINLAIGGAWGGEQGIDDSIFPQEYIIDYVRIFDLEN